LEKRKTKKGVNQKGKKGGEVYAASEKILSGHDSQLPFSLAS